MTLYVRGTTLGTVYVVDTGPTGKPRMRLATTTESTYANIAGVVTFGSDDMLAAIMTEAGFDPGTITPHPEPVDPEPVPYPDR